MRYLRKILNFFGITLLLFVLIVVGFIFYVNKVSNVDNPVVTNNKIDSFVIEHFNDSISLIGNNWIHKKQEGLYEMYTEGAAYERGLINGKLSEPLIVAQEAAFVKQIKHMIPSDKYLGFLKYIIGFVNRDLEEHVTDEYQQEIFGISQASSDSFNWIGTKYFRQLNYHAAHDIGHALQNMMLVGCTSFGAIASATDSGELIIGRNFDFWVGDDFAANKIISFVRPNDGYPFGFVTWGAFIGICSGMNTEGLTVTINAAKSSIPLGAATPVSLVAREILQYAKNIDEAIAIAHKRKMFVSESFLIGSSKDRKTIVIEKTPDTLAIYDTGGPIITCANHYQSQLLENQNLNIEQKEYSASVYRQQRLEELINNYQPLNINKVADILRDTKGINGEDIGWGNEKAINQLVAHHAVIFKPDQLLMYVSTSPWQLGAFVCYDLNIVFDKNLDPLQKIKTMYGENISADSATINSKGFNDFLAFRIAKMNWMYDKTYIEPNFLVSLNPNYYDAYRLAGDMFKSKNDKLAAHKMYTIALQKEIATKQERDAIEKKIKETEKNN